MARPVSLRLLRAMEARLKVAEEEEKEKHKIADAYRFVVAQLRSEYEGDPRPPEDDEDDADLQDILNYVPPDRDSTPTNQL